MDSVTIENRPRLRCCNVFVHLRTVRSTRVGTKLSRGVISLSMDERSYELDLGQLRIIPTSLSCLKVTGNWISFRIQTSLPDSQYGSFLTELVGMSPSSEPKRETSSASCSEPPKDKNLVFSCSCCKNQLTKELVCKKVLPLPSNDCDPADFFCCSHNGENYSEILEPRPSDYLYGPHYALMSRQNFREELRITEQSVVCDRCLAVVGVPNSALSLKLWNCCVQFAHEDKSSVKRSDPLLDFKSVVQSCSDGLERILLETRESGATRYLLIKPMERNLDLLVEPDHLDDSRYNLKLLVKRVMKVLYHYAEETDSSLIRDSRTDGKNVRIGLKCMLAGIRHLLRSSERVPPVYRNIDGYHVGYISLDASEKT